MLTKTTEKRKQIYLSNRQKWQIAKWLIDNQCISQHPHLQEEVLYDAEGNISNFMPFNFWRTKKITAVEEAREKFGIDINPHHLDSSIHYYNESCIITGVHSNVQATVEMDMLKAKCVKLENEKKELEDKITSSDDLLKKTVTQLDFYKQIVDAITQLLPKRSLAGK